MTIPGAPAAKELARWYVDEVLNQGRTDALSQRLSADFALYVPPSLAEGPVVQGPEAFAGVIAALRTAFPDLRFTIHDLVADQHVAMVSFTMEGTHSDTWLGVPATAKRLRMVGVDVIRVARGRIEQIRIHGDYLGALQQLGAIPAR
jgi:steroid delta-isomerase-like uncharacterized protein